MNRARHCMPFGANVETDGVYFSLYAPDVPHVDLLIDGREPIRVGCESGWKRAYVAGPKRAIVIDTGCQTG